MEAHHLVFKDNIIHRPDLDEYNEDAEFLGHEIIKSLTGAGDKTMLIDGLTGETLSARQLLNKSFKISKALISVGIKRGDVVSVISENRFELPSIIFGTIFLNCILAPINSTYVERELVHTLSLSKPKLIFVSDSTAAKVCKAIKSLNYVKKVILIDDGPALMEGVVRWQEFINSKLLNEINFESQPADRVKPICAIFCSSGTTGLPKGVQLSQVNLVAKMRSFYWLTKNFDFESIVLNFLPLYHCYGFIVLLVSIVNVTGPQILLPTFEEKSFFGCIERYRCTVLFLVPPLMVFLAKSEAGENYDLTCVRLIYVGAAITSKETEQAVMDRLKKPNLMIRQLYGMTELSGDSCVTKDIKKVGSIGDVNLGMYAKVIDDNGNALGPNETGELCFKGTGVMAGYIGNDQATKEVIDNDGWLHTGDVGYYDDDLQFYIVDRIKELIKYKGFQVPPAEVEALLLTHPGIKDCGVIGKPDEAAGELPMAFVVRSDKTLTESEIVDFVNKDASPAKKLRGGVIFVDDIPKNVSGKILRRELREWLKIDQNCNANKNGCTLK